MKWTNEITRLLNLDYPVVQAPMFGTTTPEMVAAAARANCLGALPLGDLNAEQCEIAIKATKKLTNKPFAVNSFVYEIPEITPELKEDYKKAKAFIAQLASHYKIEVNLPELSEIKVNSYREHLDVIISENCKIMSFTFGNLDKPSIDKLKNHDIILIGTCTSVEEALILEESGIDIVCVQGIEAGGHRGGFDTENIPKIGGLSLLSQVIDSIKIPVIYAGGLYNSRTILAAKTLGAQGYQIGSLLLGTKESALKPFEKQRLQNINEKDIILTRSFTGRYARGIKNVFSEAIEKVGLTLPYPYQNKLTAELRKSAKASNNPDFVSIWTGQSINGYSDKSTEELLTNLIRDTERDAKL